MAASDDRVAVATSRSLAIYSEEAGWRTVEFVLPTELAVAVAPQHVLAGQGYLWLGFDHGEFGGGLYRMRVKDEGPLPAPEPIRRINVLGIEQGVENEIWIGGNVFHLGERRGVLLRADSGHVSELTLKWPTSSRARVFSAFTVSMDRLPLVIDVAEGVYEVRNNEPTLLLEGKLTVRRETTERTTSGVSIPVVDRFSPTDLVAWPDGRLFVATNGLGVLELRPNGVVEVRQRLLR